jgi:hypothetical protein
MAKYAMRRKIRRMVPFGGKTMTPEEKAEFFKALAECEGADFETCNARVGVLLRHYEALGRLAEFVRLPEWIEWAGRLGARLIEEEKRA